MLVIDYWHWVMVMVCRLSLDVYKYLWLGFICLVLGVSNYCGGRWVCVFVAWRWVFVIVCCCNYLLTLGVCYRCLALGVCNCLFLGVG